MGDEEQLAILKQGVKTWNEWRENNPDEEIDLSAANLNRADLGGADLGGVDLSGTNLSKVQLNGAILSAADLRGAYLSMAHLGEANLPGADLSGALLISADFTKADLRGAFLRGASLLGAELHETDLREADLSNCTLGQTNLVDVDLRQVKGLETVKHDYPSEISISTIYKSKGIIPEVFLRGCGVPENFITFMHSLTGKAFEYYSCFISYSTKDKEFAERVYADLQSKGVRCWFAPEDLKIGDKFRARIDEAIRVYDKLMIVLSENSINSTWVEKEVETAFEREGQQKRTMLFPVRLDDAVMKTDQAWAADIRRTRHIGDMSNWKDQDSYQKAFERLLRDLQAEDAKS